MRTEPVLLVHGFATTAAQTWGENGWIDLLGDAGREVIAPDLLGHGSAPKPHDPEAYDGLEDGVLALLPDTPVDAVAFSLGARVVLTLASRHPDRFARIVVAGVGANLFRSDDSGVIVAALRSESTPDDPVARYFASLAQQPGADPEALAALMERQHPPLGAAELARITAPVLVVLGDADFAGPADPLVDALPDARLVTLRGVDHFATPKSFTFIDAALEFLEAVP